MLDLQRGASCDLVDCRLLKGGIRLGPNSSANLVRTSLSEARCTGILGSNFDSLRLQECQVTRCLGDGLNLAQGRNIEVFDCTFAHNTVNGTVLAGENSSWQIERCTFSGNGHFGIWVETDTDVQVVVTGSLVAPSISFIDVRQIEDSWTTS